MSEYPQIIFKNIHMQVLQEKESQGLAVTQIFLCENFNNVMFVESGS